MTHKTPTLNMTSGDKSPQRHEQ